MSDINTQASEATSSGNGVTVVPSLEERSNAAFGISEPAADTGEAAPNPPAGEAPASTAASGTDPAAERRARLDALKAAERQRVDEQAKKREQDNWRQRAEEAERRAKEAEERAQARIDVSTLDEAGFFEMAERLNVTPQKLGEFIRKRIENPEAIAAQAASRAVDPKLSALEQKLAQQQQVIDRFLAEQQSAKQHAEEQAAAREFNSFVTENATSAPYSARFLKAHGGDEFYKLAQSAAQSVPPGAGWQAVLDIIEENLTAMASIYASDASSTGKQAPPTHPAAAKASTTVSNTLAQGRASVVDEETDWAALPFEERSSRLFR